MKVRYNKETETFETILDQYLNYRTGIVWSLIISGGDIESLRWISETYQAA